MFKTRMLVRLMRYSLVLPFFFLNLNIQSESVIDTSMVLNQAVSLYYQGDFTDSLECLRKQTSITPADPLVRLNLIRLLREMGQYPEAMANLDILMKQAPTEASYRLALHEIACLAGEPKLLPVNSVFPSEIGNAELFWRGLSLFDQGKVLEAKQLLEKSIGSQPFNPAAYYFLGQISLQQQKYEAAKTYYRKALSQEPNFTLAFFPLAQCYIALEQYKTAYNLLLNARTASPGNPQITVLLKTLTDERPELVEKKVAEQERKRTSIIPPFVKTIAEGRETIPEIRIGLVEKVEQLYIKTGDQFQLKNLAGESYTGQAETVLLVRFKNEAIELLDSKEKQIFKTNQSLILTYANPGATTVLFDVEWGKGFFWANHEDRIYRGKLEFIPKAAGITVVNQVNIEEYLYSVVPSEMSSTWPAAALESQAIAARTYAFANMGQFSARGFDLLATVASQAYNGVSRETKATTVAVDATRGKVLIYNGKPIAAFFSGNSGGHTESSQNVWNLNLPYLQAVPDKLLSSRSNLSPPHNLAEWLSNRPQTFSSNPKYSSRSSYRWVKWVPRADIEKRLNLGDKLGNITAIITTGRGSSGLVQRVLVKGTNGEYPVKGDAIRSKLGGLRSNLFIVEPKIGTDGLPEYFIFTGGGWGHGVGMCQSGAAGMAAAQYTSPEILAHYYPGTELVDRY